MNEPQDPSLEEQLAARIWAKYKTDKRFPYCKLGLKMWKEGCKNMGQIMEALEYLHSQEVVRSPWAVVMSSPVVARALQADLKARAAEASRVDKGPQRVGDILGQVVGAVQGRAMDRAESASDGPKPLNKPSEQTS